MPAEGELVGSDACQAAVKRAVRRARIAQLLSLTEAALLEFVPDRPDLVRELLTARDAFVIVRERLYPFES